MKLIPIPIARQLQDNLPEDIAYINPERVVAIIPAKIVFPDGMRRNLTSITCDGASFLTQLSVLEVVKLCTQQLH